MFLTKISRFVNKFNQTTLPDTLLAVSHTKNVQDEYHPWEMQDKAHAKEKKPSLPSIVAK